MIIIIDNYELLITNDNYEILIITNFKVDISYFAT